SANLPPGAKLTPGAANSHWKKPKVALAKQAQATRPPAPPAGMLPALEGRTDAQGLAVLSGIEQGTSPADSPAQVQHVRLNASPESLSSPFASDPLPLW